MRVRVRVLRPRKPLCVDAVCSPCARSCGNSHNVCLECAKGLWQNKSNQVASNSITCPVCRANCVCPSGVERLPLNLALKNMVEKLEAAQKGKALGRKPSVRRKLKCDVCEKKAAVMECVTCVVKYCEACLETCHPKERAVFRAHVVAPMEPVSGRSCETHEGQALSFFCTQCGVMVCAHCLLMGAHIEHPRVSLHTAVMDRKEQFVGAVEALKSKHALVQDFTVRAESAIDQLTQSCRSIRQQVESECGELHMRVNELQQKLLQVVDARERQRRAVLMGQLEGQRQKISVWSGMLKRAAQIMSDEDGAVFLDVNTNVLDKQLRGAADASLNPPALQTVSAGLTLNLGQVINTVGNLHFSELMIPAPPSGISCVEQAAAQGKSFLLITWKCGTVCNDSNTFVVEQRKFHETWPLEHENLPWVEIYKGPNRTCTAAALDDHSSYCFRISATNSSGCSGWSPAAIFTTGLPPTPAALMLLHRTSRSLSVAWQGEPALCSQHCSYILEVSGAPASAHSSPQPQNWRQVYTGTWRTAVISKLASNTNYAVRVAALNTWGQSSPSAPQFFTTSPQADNDVHEEDDVDQTVVSGPEMAGLGMSPREHDVEERNADEPADEEGNDESRLEEFDVAEQSMNAPLEEAEGFDEDNEVGNMASVSEEEEMVPL